MSFDTFEVFEPFTPHPEKGLVKYMCWKPDEKYPVVWLTIEEITIQLDKLEAEKKGGDDGI